jgi:hypothetical protein
MKHSVTRPYLKDKRKLARVGPANHYRVGDYMIVRNRRGNNVWWVYAKWDLRKPNTEWSLACADGFITLDDAFDWASSQN